MKIESRNSNKYADNHDEAQCSSILRTMSMQTTTRKHSSILRTTKTGYLRKPRVAMQFTFTFAFTLL